MFGDFLKHLNLSMLILLPSLASWFWGSLWSSLCIWWTEKVAAVFVFYFFSQAFLIILCQRNRMKFYDLNKLNALCIKLNAIVDNKGKVMHMKLCWQTALASWDSQSGDYNHKWFQWERNGRSIYRHQLHCPGSLLTRSNSKRADTSLTY